MTCLNHMTGVPQVMFRLCQEFLENPREEIVRMKTLHLYGRVYLKSCGSVF